MSPLVAWFSKHGVKAIGALVVIELLFHVYAITSTNRTTRRAAEEAARLPAAQDTVTR